MNEFDTLIEVGLRTRATDIHICENLTPRLRIDNRLQEFSQFYAPPNLVVEQILSRLPPNISEKSAKQFAEGKDIDCAITTFSNSRVRANIYRTNAGTQIALRILPAKILTAGEIGLPFAITEVCKKKSGLFVVTGANSSGKTTTLASLIEIINNSQPAHILTIENPIEYVFKNKMSIISQREVGIHTPSFYDALRSAVRENPDVVVLGEMRDIETTRIAIELAEMGRLVFATLHTRTATSTIDRLIGQFPSGEQEQIRMMISENLIGVLSQTLLAKKAGGLIAGFEYLQTTDAVKNMIRERKIPQLLSVMQTSRNLGMMTMEDSIKGLLEKGIITEEEAKLKSYRGI